VSFSDRICHPVNSGVDITPYLQEQLEGSIHAPFGWPELAGLISPAVRRHSPQVQVNKPPAQSHIPQSHIPHSHRQRLLAGLEQLLEQPANQLQPVKASRTGCQPIHRTLLNGEIASYIII